MDKEKMSAFQSENKNITQWYVKSRQTLKDKAFARAQAVAAVLKKDFKADQVILFGSLAEGAFREGSDIDIFVEGWQGLFWDMYLQAEKAAHPFTVSIVCFEDAKPSLVQEVKEKGVYL